MVGHVTLALQAPTKEDDGGTFSAAVVLLAVG
jgi:hypothetical protein